MSMIKVDARGLGCPKPVIATKQALDSLTEGQVTTLVDNVVSKENVVKFAGSQGYGVMVEAAGDDFAVTILKGVSAKQAETENHSGSVYLLTSDLLGQGDEQLGAILMKAFFVSLQEMPPKKILLLNAAVRLALADSPVLEALSSLNKQGTQVLACGTCLDFYGVKEMLAIGEVTNMFVLIEALNGPEKAITL